MSELMSEMDRAAAAYWLKVARQGADPSMALARARQYIVEARAESRMVDSSRQPTLDQIEAPPLGLRRSF